MNDPQKSKSLKFSSLEAWEQAVKEWGESLGIGIKVPMMIRALKNISNCGYRDYYEQVAEMFSEDKRGQAYLFLRSLISLQVQEIEAEEDAKTEREYQRWSGYESGEREGL